MARGFPYRDSVPGIPGSGKVGHRLDSSSCWWRECARRGGVRETVRYVYRDGPTGPQRRETRVPTMPTPSLLARAGLTWPKHLRIAAALAHEWAGSTLEVRGQKGNDQLKRLVAVVGDDSQTTHARGRFVWDAPLALRSSLPVVYPQTLRLFGRSETSAQGFTSPVECPRCNVKGLSCCAADARCSAAY